MTDTPEMPTMHPDGQERARRVRDADPVLGRDFSTKLGIDVAYRDGFIAGVLAERSRIPVDAAAIRRAVLTEAEKAAAGGDHSECGHGEGYTDGRLDAAAAIAALATTAPAQPVEDGWRSDMEAAPRGVPRGAASGFTMTRHSKPNSPALSWPVHGEGDGLRRIRPSRL